MFGILGYLLGFFGFRSCFEEKAHPPKPQKKQQDKFLAAAQRHFSRHVHSDEHTADVGCRYPSYVFAEHGISHEFGWFPSAAGASE